MQALEGFELIECADTAVVNLQGAVEIDPLAVLRSQALANDFQITRCGFVGIVDGGIDGHLRPHE